MEFLEIGGFEVFDFPIFFAHGGEVAGEGVGVALLILFAHLLEKFAVAGLEFLLLSTDGFELNFGGFIVAQDGALDATEEDVGDDAAEYG